MTRLYFILIILIVNTQFIWGQIYVEKQTRHRFAQLNLGMDIQSSFGGNFSYINIDDDIISSNLPNSYTPRIVIGATHFWGHADFYIAIPIYNSVYRNDGQSVLTLSGVETVFKYYPWRIKHNKLRPFVGLALSPFYYEQKNENLNYGNGPELSHIAAPIYTGITFNNKNKLIELGLMWNYSNTQSYSISRNDRVNINTPPVYLNLSFRYMLETTLSAEKAWESGKTAEVTQKLAAAKRLNGFYAGIGLSSAFWISESDYNEQNRPYIEKFGTSIMPEFSIGYYLHEPDLNFDIAFRQYGTSTNTYGVIQQLRRRSVVMEATKSLFDYHGFVPFVGPAISYEKLSFKESFEGQKFHDLVDNKIAYGITFGWDIRPNRIQSWLLRTNLRWYPNLNLEVDIDNRISFNNIEFNFIQLIIYPNRM